MNYLCKKKLYETYPIGSKVKLLKMDDPYAPPIGSIGVIKGFDDLGSILVQWENYGRLNIIQTEDKIQIIK